MLLSVIDYGVGNLFSVKNALDYIGVPSKITNEKSDLISADAIILPGVGAFPDAMNRLKETGLDKVITEMSSKKPLLGICLGMQMLFEKSYEFCECEGLGLIPGEVILINAEGLKIPHMGWNSLKFVNSSPILDGINEGEYVYFVHSYRAKTSNENINAYCEYGENIPALVSCGNVFGTQFHPEKSGEVGLTMLKNFWRLAI